MAIEVVAGLRDSGYDARLVMAGQDKGLQAEAARYAGSLGLGDAIRFPGFLDMAGKAREGSAADIFINTNRVDNMPVAVVEACAMGLPVVATDVGGLGHLLTEGQDGLLVPDGDVMAMVSAVRRLLEDPDLAERLSIHGRQLAERSSWAQVRAQWEALFTRCETRGAAARTAAAHADWKVWRC
jgi:glycosyltransferase involved in cell wall biosynthesis